MSKHKRLVLGLVPGGAARWCGPGGEWRKNLPKILKTFENSFLISTASATYVFTEFLYREVGKDRLFLDSGGYSLFVKESKTEDKEEFSKICENMKKKFLKILSIAEFDTVFELDNEYFRKDEDLLSPRNFCRQEVKDITGSYPTPVFKMHQGFQYWKDLCESELYQTLSIGGLAPTRSWHVHREDLIKMVNYARQCGKKVHLLGCRNVETARAVKPDTVDYDISLFAVNYALARKEHPHLAANDPVFYKCMAAHAFANAKSRSFLYDTMDEFGDEE